MSAILKVPSDAPWRSEDYQTQAEQEVGVAEAIPVLAPVKLKGEDLWGSIDCSVGGLLVVTFDNTNSWWNAKTIRYCFELEERGG